VPWIALLDPDTTTTAIDGLYLVYLDTSAIDAVYLSMNQGATQHLRNAEQDGHKGRAGRAGRDRRDRRCNDSAPRVSTSRGKSIYLHKINTLAHVLRHGIPEARGSG
jgi:hypothetical protein